MDLPDEAKFNGKTIAIHMPGDTAEQLLLKLLVGANRLGMTGYIDALLRGYEERMGEDYFSGASE